jgi:uncharacterized membrane-anchored protein
MKIKTGFVVIGIPVGIMAAWLISLLVALSQAQEVTFEVTGYDPRSLISGHYLRYQVDLGAAAPYGSFTPLCACLTADEDGVSRASWIGPCSATSCPLFIRGSSLGGPFDMGIDRYYIPDEYMDELAVVPPHATVKALVTKSGRAIVTGMFVEGVPILEWAKAHKGAL